MGKGIDYKIQNMEVEIIETSKSGDFVKLRIMKILPGMGRVIGNAFNMCNLYTEGIAPIAYSLYDINNRADASELYIQSAREIAVRIRLAMIKTDLNMVTLRATDKVYQQGEFIKLGDLQPEEEGVEIVNPELELFQVSSERSIDFSILFVMGQGYLDEDDYISDQRLSAEVNKPGVVRLDCNFSPIKSYRYKVVESVDGLQTEELIISLKMIPGTKPLYPISTTAALLARIFDSLKNLAGLNMISVDRSKDPGNEEADNINSLLKNIPIEELVLNYNKHNELKELGFNSLRDVLMYEKLDDELRAKIRTVLKRELTKAGIKVDEN